MKRQRICITGGHLSPAYSVASFIKNKYSDYSILFIGREKSFTTGTYASLSVEKDVMSSVSDAVYLFPFERLGISPAKIYSFLHVFIRTFLLLGKERPSVVVSFGGYVGLMVGLAALCRGIPIVIHEQTHILGMGNRILAKFAAKVLVSFPEMETSRFIYTGFPLREEIKNPPAKVSFEISSGKPVVYITGGTTGAVSINDICFPIISKLLPDYVVVHQTGKVSLEKAKYIRSSFPQEIQPFYYIADYISPSDVSWLMHNAAVIISRSGANTVYELAVTKVPSILIPLATTENNEQQMNAEWLKPYAYTIIHQQKDLTSDILLRSIETLRSTEHHSGTSTVEMDGTKRIVEEIVSVL